MNLQALGAEERAASLLFIGFNQDAGCFACGTDDGFRIYNVEPFKELFRREFASGGIGIVEMLFRSNILALVGGGKNPRHEPNKVVIWDDHQNRVIGELSFNSGPVKGVRMYRGRIVVVLEKKTYLYNFQDLKVVLKIETASNKLGLCGVSYTENEVIASLGNRKGLVEVNHIQSSETTYIDAHESDIHALALNTNGTLVATASEKGTLVRVFDSKTGERLHELRRGSDRALIHCIQFNNDSSFLACSSDKGTVHIFALDESELIHRTNSGEDSSATQNASSEPRSGGGGTGGTGGNASSSSSSSSSSSNSSRDDKHGNVPTSTSLLNQLPDASASFSYVRGFLPSVFNPVKSYAQFRVAEAHFICAFGADRYSLVVVSASGKFWKVSFKGGGECEKISFHQCLKEDHDDE